MFILYAIYKFILLPYIVIHCCTSKRIVFCFTLIYQLNKNLNENTTWFNMFVSYLSIVMNCNGEHILCFLYNSIRYTQLHVQPARNLHLNTRHRDLPQRVRWKWPPWSVFFADISGGHRCSIATAVNTARRGVRTPRIPMAGHGGPLFYTIYMYNVNDEKPLTAMIPRGRPLRILAFGHRDTRGSWPPGSTGVRPQCLTARG